MDADHILSSDTFQAINLSGLACLMCISVLMYTGCCVVCEYCYGENDIRHSCCVCCGDIHVLCISVMDPVEYIAHCCVPCGCENVHSETLRYLNILGVQSLYNLGMQNAVDMNTVGRALLNVHVSAYLTFEVSTVRSF